LPGSEDPGPRTRHKRFPHLAYLTHLT
jgi:hypothetical protein